MTFLIENSHTNDMFIRESNRDSADLGDWNHNANTIFKTITRAFADGALNGSFALPNVSLKSEPPTNEQLRAVARKILPKHNSEDWTRSTPENRILTLTDQELADVGSLVDAIIDGDEKSIQKIVEQYKEHPEQFVDVFWGVTLEVLRRGLKTGDVGLGLSGGYKDCELDYANISVTTKDQSGNYVRHSYSTGGRTEVESEE